MLMYELIERKNRVGYFYSLHPLIPPKVIYTMFE